MSAPGLGRVNSDFTEDSSDRPSTHAGSSGANRAPWLRARLAGAPHVFQLAVGILERAVDLTVVTAGALGAQAVYEFFHLGKQAQYPASLMLKVSGAFALLFVFMLDWDGGYRSGNSLLRIRETERILRVTAKTFPILFTFLFLSGELFSRWLLVLALLVIPLLLIIEKQLFWHVIGRMHAQGHGVENVLLYGAGLTGRTVFSVLTRSPKLGLNPVAVVDDNPSLTGKMLFECSYRRERSVQILRGPVSKQLIEGLGVSVVMIAIPSLASERFDQVLSEAMAAQARVAFVPKLSLSSDFLMNCTDIDGLLVSELRPPVHLSGYDTVKRIFDVVAGALLIVLTAPVWLLIALYVRISSPGPVFFRQTRIGRGGKAFNLYKFRSMYADAEKYAHHPVSADDPRITPVGKVLRRTGLDELPQLFNVVRGEMSLVGPRPEMPFIVEQYDACHRQRLNVMPGITGLWQLSADRAFLIHENILYDLYYIQHRRFFMDVAILLHTIVFAMRGV